MCTAVQYPKSYGLSGNWAISFDNLYQGTLLQSSATKTNRPSPLQTSNKAGKTSTPSLNREKWVTETENTISVLKKCSPKYNGC